MLIWYICSCIFLRGLLQAFGEALRMSILALLLLSRIDSHRLHSMIIPASAAHICLPETFIHYIHVDAHTTIPERRPPALALRTGCQPSRSLWCRMQTYRRASLHRCVASHCTNRRLIGCPVATAPAVSPSRPRSSVCYRKTGSGKKNGAHVTRQVTRQGIMGGVW